MEQKVFEPLAIKCTEYTENFVYFPQITQI